MPDRRWTRLRRYCGGRGLRRGVQRLEDRTRTAGFRRGGPGSLFAAADQAASERVDEAKIPRPEYPVAVGRILQLLATDAVELFGIHRRSTLLCEIVRKTLESLQYGASLPAFSIGFDMYRK